MSCKKCKEKNNSNHLLNEVPKSFKSVEISVKIFMVLWTLLGVYGLISIINKFI